MVGLSHNIDIVNKNQFRNRVGRVAVDPVAPWRLLDKGAPSRVVRVRMLYRGLSQVAVSTVISP
jgi:hypothetical protein